MNEILHYDAFCMIFSFLDRYTLAQCSLVCRTWYHYVKTINCAQQNWYKYDKIAAHYKNVIIPKVLSQPRYILPDYYYIEMISKPDKFGTAEYAINSIITRTPQKRQYLLWGMGWNRLSDILIEHIFMVYFIYKKDLIQNFEEIIIPYVCAGELMPFDGKDVYDSFTHAINRQTYMSLSNIDPKNHIYCVGPEWVRHHYLNVIDLFIWYYNKNPDIFKKHFAPHYDPKWPPDTGYLFRNLTKADIYIYNVLSKENKKIINNLIISRKDKGYHDIKNNFGQKYSIKLIIELLKTKPGLRRWILENAPEWIFNLVKSRQRKLLKIFIKLEKKKLRKLKNSENQNLYQYTLSLKHGPPLDNIRDDLKKLKCSS